MKAFVVSTHAIRIGLCMYTQVGEESVDRLNHLHAAWHWTTTALNLHTVLQFYIVTLYCDTVFPYQLVNEFGLLATFTDRMIRY